LENISYLTLIVWYTWWVQYYGGTLWDSNNRPRPGEGLYIPRNGIPEEGPGPSKGLDPKLSKTKKIIVYVFIGILTISTAGFLISGLFKKSEETGYPEPESSPDPCVAFPEGSSGYYTNDQINLMLQYGMEVVYTSVFSIYFPDGSSGNYTYDQIELMRQYGLVK
jgi:hypothetical protein